MPIKTAVVGFGLAGRVFHAPFVNAVDGLELSAVVQRHGDEAAQAYPRAQIFRSLDELLQSDVALLVIGTPNQTHVPMARAALSAGKHVVVDKPLATTSAEAEELEVLAAKQGVLLAPFHNRRFDGDFLTLRRLLQEGAVGRPVTLASRFDRFRPLQRPNTWKETGGPEHGLLMDLGPHLIDQALFLFGRPETVFANVRVDRERSDIEDAFDLSLHFRQNERSLRVDLGATMLAADPQPRFLLQGTGGSFRKYGVDPQEPAILNGAVVPHEGDADAWLEEDEAHWGALTTAVDPQSPSNLERRTVRTERGDYRLFYAAMANAIQHGAPPPTTPRDAVRVARILEMARESSRTGQTLAVPANF